MTDFPLFAWNAEAQRWDAEHHMFSNPQAQYLDHLEQDPAAVRGELYDAVINGIELASGSIRIHDPALQRRVFAILGISEAEAAQRFGFMLDAFRYGAPPHGGAAIGFDRTVMVMAGEATIRDVIAFPKNTWAASPLDDSPAPLDPHQLAGTCTYASRLPDSPEAASDWRPLFGYLCGGRDPARESVEEVVAVPDPCRGLRPVGERRFGLGEGLFNLRPAFVDALGRTIGLIVGARCHHPDSLAAIGKHKGFPGPQSPDEIAGVLLQRLRGNHSHRPSVHLRA